MTKKVLKLNELIGNYSYSDLIKLKFYISSEHRISLKKLKAESDLIKKSELIRYCKLLLINDKIIDMAIFYKEGCIVMNTKYGGLCLN
jgi:hypothetical protein